MLELFCSLLSVTLFYVLLEDMFQLEYHPSSSLLYGAATPLMGTRLEILFTGKNESESRAIGEAVFHEVARLDKLISRFDPESELYQLNRQAVSGPAKVGEELWNILLNCKKYYHLTSGLFDISLKGMEKSIVCDKKRRTLTFTRSDLSFDLGGYGKGLVLQHIKVLLQEQNIQHALINFGNSSVLAIGSHPYGDYWQIGIAHPVTGCQLGSVRLKDNSMSTSGNTPVHPAHIIDPRSNRYYKGTEMVTVLSREPLDAEVLSTTLLLCDKQQQESILQHIEIEEVFRWEL